jgi:hypothetical protein
VAKGQKRSNREVRKPKTAAPKVAAVARSFLEPVKSSGAAAAQGKGPKGGRGHG